MRYWMTIILVGLVQPALSQVWTNLPPLAQQPFSTPFEKSIRALVPDINPYHAAQAIGESVVTSTAPATVTLSWAPSIGSAWDPSGETSYTEIWQATNLISGGWSMIAFSYSNSFSMPVIPSSPFYNTDSNWWGIWLFKTVSVSVDGSRWTNLTTIR
jgi:hypothetical protein